MHDMIYSDPKDVRRARLIAESRIAQRRLWETLVESWAVPVLNWMDRRLCALEGHKPQYDRLVSWHAEGTHYPHPCRCGDMLGEHMVCDCEKYW
jgi:hypothetical protein